MSDVSAAELRQQGLSWRDIADRLGVSLTHARYLGDPDYANRAKASSREAKRRRTGTCVDCGARTGYNGGPQHSDVSLRCPECAGLATRRLDRDRIVELRKTGLTQHQIASIVGCSQGGVSDVLRAVGMGVGRGRNGHTKEVCSAPGDCPQAGCPLCDPQGALAKEAA